jgi:hypothetical protein
VQRGIRGLTVVASFAAGTYLVQRVRAHLREHERLRALALPPPRVEPARFAGRAPAAGQAPAGALAKVATMEATPVPAPSSAGTNGAGTNGAGTDGAGTDGAGTKGAGANATATPVVSAPTTVARLLEPKGPVELPAPRKLSGTVLATLAALLGVAAIALSATAFVSSVLSDDSDEPGAAVAEAETISLLSKPSTQRVPVANSGGRIVLAVGTEGRAVLVLDGLGLAPEGQAYQAWVIRPDASAPSSAAIFSGMETIVPLSVSVRPGAVVAITIERAGGATAPSERPKLVAIPSA